MFSRLPFLPRIMIGQLVQVSVSVRCLPEYFVSQAPVGPFKDQDVKESWLSAFFHSELDLRLNTVEGLQETSELFFPVAPDYKGIVYILEPTSQLQ